MFSIRTGLHQSSSVSGLRILTSAVIFSLATLAPAYAFPKLSDPTTVPSESKEQNTPETDEKSAQPEPNIDEYLYRLMMAESAGKPHAKNPRSSALGPYQFINSTFIEVVDKHFADEVEGMSRSEILALRTDMEFARRAAIAFNDDNAKYLEERGVKPTFAHLRLSHLLGPAAAVKVLRAKPNTRLTSLLPSSVIRANPFMRRMTVAMLVRWSEREVGVGVWSTPREIAKSDESEPSASEVKNEEATEATSEKAEAEIAQDDSRAL